MITRPNASSLTLKIFMIVFKFAPVYVRRLSAAKPFVVLLKSFAPAIDPGLKYSVMGFMVHFTSVGAISATAVATSTAGGASA